MITTLVFALISQCSGPACPNPCTACTFPPDTGSNPSLSSWRTVFADVAQRQNLSGLPDIATIEVGPTRTRQGAEFPCRIMPAIAAAESGMAQFCSNGQTIISFDCGFGVMQVTSGASRYPGLQSRVDINVAAGADILAQKWNGDQSFGGRFGASDPQFIESWYFATWAYNGFVYSNNPQNPDRAPAPRPPFHSPASLSRGSYPYQEIVWGYLGFPLEREGELVVDAVAVTYPAVCNGNVAACCDENNVCSGIPNQSGLFSVTVPLPQPAHADPCVEVCPPSGCPPAERRRVVFDDNDAGFSLQGDTSLVTAHDEGGFQDGFRSVAPTAGPATLTATWEGPAPASGTFDVSGFVPLNPAENDAITVSVFARGGVRRFTMDHNVAGGFFQPLGSVALLQGETVRVVVDNVSADLDGHIGLDAFAFDWRGDGDVVGGGACGDSVDCAGDAICVGGACVDGCDVAGCATAQTCDRGSGLCVDAGGEGEGEGEGGEGEGEGEGGEGEGEGGEGEGEDEPFGELPKSVVGCSCAGASAGDGAADVALPGLALVLWRRRRRSGTP
jgi:hypothetical protein